MASARHQTIGYKPRIRRTDLLRPCQTCFARWQVVRIEERPQEEWIEIPGATPLIITTEQFESVQVALKGPRRRLVSPPRNYLLRGYVSCAHCGGPMTGTTLNRRYRYYQCGRARSSTYRQATCTAKYVRAEPLEENVWREVVRILEDPDVILAEIEQRRVAGKKYGEEDVNRVTRQLKSVEKQRARIFRLARFEDFDDDKIAAELQDVRNREEVLEREKATIEALREELGSMDDARDSVTMACAQVRAQLSNMNYESKRMALDAIRAKVVADPDSSTLYACLPSYVTIARTSGYVSNSDVEGIPFESPLTMGAKRPQTAVPH